LKRLVLCTALCLTAIQIPSFPQEPAPGREAAAPQPAAPKPDDPLPGAAAPAASPAAPIWVSTEIRFPNYFSSLFYAFYAGDRIDLRVLIHNISKEEVPVPKDLDVLAGLRVTAEGGKELKPAAPPGAWKNELPARLAPGQVLGGLYDLSEAFPNLASPDNYTIQWESGSWKSNLLGVRVLPRFNPDAEYEATLDTEQGEIRLGLYGKEAPAHVRNFINLARLGYYDGLPFHTTARDRSIRTGAPGPDGTGSVGYALPAEISALKHVPGAISMYRDQRAPGNESDGSQFFICLADLPNRDGKFTVFGNVLKGLEVARKISERETVTDPKRPAGTPVEAVKIRRIMIQEKPRSEAGKG